MKPSTQSTVRSAAIRPSRRASRLSGAAEPTVVEPVVGPIAAFVYTTAPADAAAILPRGLSPALRKGRAVWVALFGAVGGGGHGNGNGNGNGNGHVPAAHAVIEYRIAVRRAGRRTGPAWFRFRTDADGPLPEAMQSAAVAQPTARVQFAGRPERIVAAVRSGRGQMRDAEFELEPTAAPPPADSVFADAAEAIAAVFGPADLITVESAGERLFAARWTMAAAAAQIVRPVQARFQLFQDGLHLRPGAATADVVIHAPAGTWTVWAR